MDLYVVVWICAIFMIGRNAASLFFKIRDLLIKEKRTQWTEKPSRLFTLIILIITAIAGLLSGFTMLFLESLFGFYLFIVVSGMMIYSYFVYAGTCLEEKKWFMFGLCIFVIVFTSILAGIMCHYLAIGIID